MADSYMTELERNLEYARRLITGGKALQGLQGLHSDGLKFGDLSEARPDDLYRAAWSQAVSALDHWLHQEVLKRAVALVKEKHLSLPKRINGLKIPFQLVKGIADDPVESVFAEVLEQEIRRDTYQRSKGISEAFRWVSTANGDVVWDQVGAALGMSAQDARDRQDDIVARRNQIAHHADLGPDGESIPMAADKASDTVDWIGRLAKALLGALPADPILVEAMEEVPAWLVRAGAKGERDHWALTNNAVGGGFNEVGDLGLVDTRAQMIEQVQQSYPDASPKLISNYAGQLWAFRGRISIGDIVVLPLKTGTKKVAIGRVTGEYRYRNDPDPGKRHTRAVEWIDIKVPWSDIRQDLKYSLGAFLTICQISRNDAAWRLSYLAEHQEDPGPRGGNESGDSELTAE